MGTNKATQVQHIDPLKAKEAEQHIDPLNAMEEEMKRIQTLLGQVVVGKHLVAVNVQPAQIKAAQGQHIDP